MTDTLTPDLLAFLSDDWALALYFAALDEVHDPADALALARECMDADEDGPPDAQDSAQDALALMQGHGPAERYERPGGPWRYGEGHWETEARDGGGRWTKGAGIGEKFPTTKEGVKRLVHWHPDDPDAEDAEVGLEEADSDWLRENGLEVVAELPGGGHVLKVADGADPKEAARALRENYGGSAKVGRTSDLHDLFEALPGDAAPVHDDDQAVDSFVKDVNDAFSLVAPNEDGGYARIVPRAKVDRWRARAKARQDRAWSRITPVKAARVHDALRDLPGRALGSDGGQERKAVPYEEFSRAMYEAGLDATAQAMLEVGELKTTDLGRHTYVVVPVKAPDAHSRLGETLAYLRGMGRGDLADDVLRYWNVDGGWTDPTGKGRKKWVETGQKARYQISEPGSRKAKATAPPTTPAKAPRKPAAPRAVPAHRPTVEAAHQHVQALLARGGPATAKDVDALEQYLGGLTVAQMTELKGRLGLKASGSKAVLGRKLAERALAGTEEPPEAPPAAEEEDEFERAYREKFGYDPFGGGTSEAAPPTPAPATGPADAARAAALEADPRAMGGSGAPVSVAGVKQRLRAKGMTAAEADAALWAAVDRGDFFPIRANAAGLEGAEGLLPGRGDDKGHYGYLGVPERATPSPADHDSAVTAAFLPPAAPTPAGPPSEDDLSAHAAAAVTKAGGKAREALSGYVYNDHTAINDLLWAGGKGLSPERRKKAEASVRELDRLFAAAGDLPAPVEVYRAIGGHGFTLKPEEAAAMWSQFEQAAQTGATVRMKGFSSTSMGAEVFSPVSINCRIRTKRGVYVNGAVPDAEYADEREMLLPRDAEFRVVGFERQGKNRVAILEEVGRGAESTAAQGGGGAGTGAGVPAAGAGTGAPGKATAPADHDARVTAAFDKLNASGDNLVRFTDLAKASGLSIPDLHAAIGRLRQSGKWTATGMEGRHGISAEERAHAIDEGGTPLGSLSRKGGGEAPAPAPAPAPSPAANLAHVESVRKALSAKGHDLDKLAAQSRAAGHTADEFVKRFGNLPDAAKAALHAHYGQGGR